MSQNDKKLLYAVTRFNQLGNLIMPRMIKPYGNGGRLFTCVPLADSPEKALFFSNIDMDQIKTGQLKIKIHVIDPSSLVRVLSPKALERCYNLKGISDIDMYAAMRSIRSEFNYPAIVRKNHPKNEDFKIISEGVEISIGKLYHLCNK